MGAAARVFASKNGIYNTSIIGKITIKKYHVAKNIIIIIIIVIVIVIIILVFNVIIIIIIIIIIDDPANKQMTKNPE
jgi:hypothetical protein